jgi:hypothetical protein
VIDYTDCDKATNTLEFVPADKFHAAFSSPMEKQPMWKVETVY